METIVSTMIAIVTSVTASILGFMLQQKFKEIKQLKQERDQRMSERENAMRNGMVCILRKHLMDEHETWTGKGFITPKALENGLAMYKAYKTLGGNGMIDHMEEEIQSLPIRD